MITSATYNVIKSLDVNHLRRNHIVNAGYTPVIINVISEKAVEAAELHGVELNLYPAWNLYGYKLISGYGDIVPVALLSANDFTKLSDIDYRKILPAGEMNIHLDYWHDQWRVSFLGAEHCISFIHEFQNVYLVHTGEDLSVKCFEQTSIYSL